MDSDTITDPRKIVINALENIQYSFFEGFSVLFNALKTFQKHINVAREEVDTALTWFVNYQFEKFMESILRYDVSMLNKLFDPSNTEAQNSNVISKAVFDDIADRIYKRTKEELKRGIRQCDVYSLVVIVETSDDDFESILAEKFTWKNNKLILQGDVSLFKSHFKSSKIPRLLKLLENCYTSCLFEQYIWPLFDKEHLEIVTDFVWRMLFDTQRIADRCIGFTVSNAAQLELAKEIARRSVLKKSETKRGLVFKCLLFQEFDKSFLASDESVLEEIRKLIKIHQEVALLGINEIFGGELTEKNRVLINILGKVVKSSDSSFRDKVIDIMFKIPGFVSTYQGLVSFFIEFTPSELKMQQFQMLKIAASKLGDRIRENSHVKRFFFASTYQVQLSVTERRFLMNLLLEMDFHAESENLMLFMSESYPLELRFFEEEIKGFCRKHRGSLKVVTYCLTKKAQTEFLGEFCDALEHGNFPKCRDLPISDDPAFLGRIRTLIRRILRSQNSSQKYFLIGQYVACYGENLDLELGLACDSPGSFIHGFLAGPKHSKFQIADTVYPRIIDLLKNLVLLTGHPTYADHSKIDLFCSWLIHHAKNGTEISVLTKCVTDIVAPLSKFELKFCKHRRIDESLIDLSSLKKEDWDQLRYRVIEIWPYLNDQDKQLLLKQNYSYFNILSDDPKNPEYIAVMLSSLRKEEIVPGYETYLSLKELCVAKALLTAHLFFVDDFDKEIETAGFSGLLDLVL
jgi:hypothetical protein